MLEESDLLLACIPLEKRLPVAYGFRCDEVATEALLHVRRVANALDITQ
jgi:hypothetical protein